MFSKLDFGAHSALRPKGNGGLGALGPSFSFLPCSGAWGPRTLKPCLGAQMPWGLVLGPRSKKKTLPVSLECVLGFEGVLRLEGVLGPEGVLAGDGGRGAWPGRGTF